MTEQNKDMKKLIALTAGLFLSAGLAPAGQLCEADQKWLEVVAKLIEKGNTTISTPIEERVEMLKEWAGKSGYSVEVASSCDCYRLEVSKPGAKN